jgi:hypothetical protein
MNEYTEIIQKFNGDPEHDVYALMAGLKSIGLYDIADLETKLVDEINFIVDKCPADQEWMSQDESDEVGAREDLLAVIDDLRSTAQL